MKKILVMVNIFALLATMALGFTSCKQSLTNQIIGVWKIVSYEWTDYDGKTENEQVNEESAFSLAFMEDNSFYYLESGFKDEGTYTLTGKNLVTKTKNDIQNWIIEKVTDNTLVLINTTEGDLPTKYTFKRSK